MSIGLVKFGVHAWFDYVESESNVADGGSRDGITDKMAAELGIPLMQAEHISFPSTFPNTMPEEWNAWWSAAEALSDEFVSYFNVI